MFVRRSSYNDLRDQYNDLKRQYDIILDNNVWLKQTKERYWNMYRELYEKFLNVSDQCLRVISERDSLKKKQIDDDDIKKMLLLCHPDKHGGKQMAHEVTQKLLAMRGE